MFIALRMWNIFFFQKVYSNNLQKRKKKPVKYQFFIEKSCLHLYNSHKDANETSQPMESPQSRAVKLERCLVNLSCCCTNSIQLLGVILKIKSPLDLLGAWIASHQQKEKVFNSVIRKQNWLMLPSQFCSSFLRHTLPPFLYTPHKANHTYWNGTEASEKV